MVHARPNIVLGAVDVGTNAVRLELARAAHDGSLKTVLEERDAVRPGEGVFKSGIIEPAVADRLLAVLRRYGALCRRYHARVRAVATSALREAKNKNEVVRRVRKEAGLVLEIVSGREEARLICLGVLQGKAPHTRSLCIDIGGGSTEVSSAIGRRPTNLWSVPLGAVRVTERFGSAGRISAAQLHLMHEYVREELAEELPANAAGSLRHAIGSSGTIRSVIGFASGGKMEAELDQLGDAIERLVEMGPEGRRRRFEARRADIIVAGAVLLEEVLRHLGLRSIAATDRGLRDGILLDLQRRDKTVRSELWLVDAAEAMGRRFAFDQSHARQVSRIALGLFDDLRTLHGLSLETRPVLEVASLLHDVGNVVSHERHHKHTYYLIRHADIPGMAERERELAACVARFHCGSEPNPSHPGMSGLSRPEAQIVRKLATLLRIADSLDHSHHQPVRRVAVSIRTGAVRLRVDARSPLDLELWDLERELRLFQSTFGHGLEIRSSG